MQGAPRTPRAHAVAIPRSQVQVTNEWIAMAIAVALLLAALLLP